MVRLLGFKLMLVVGAYLAIVGAQAGAPATTSYAAETDAPPFMGKALPSRGPLASGAPGGAHGASGLSAGAFAAPLLRAIPAL